MNILDHISESLETIFWVKIRKFFDADADPGSGNLFDPGSGIRARKNSDPTSGINIPDSQHCASMKLPKQKPISCGFCPETLDVRSAVLFLQYGISITLSSLSQAGFVQEQQVLCQTWRRRWGRGCRRGRGRWRRRRRFCERSHRQQPLRPGGCHQPNYQV
jgi:hypothetical protein